MSENNQIRKFLDEVFTEGLKDKTGTNKVGFAVDKDGKITKEDMREVMGCIMEDLVPENPSEYGDTGVYNWETRKEENQHIMLEDWWWRRGRKFHKGHYCGYRVVAWEAPNGYDDENEDFKKKLSQHYIFGNECTENDIIPFTELKQSLLDKKIISTDYSDIRVSKILNELGMQSKNYRFNGRNVVGRTNIRPKDAPKPRTLNELMLEKYELTDDMANTVAFNDIKNYLSNTDFKSHQINKWLLDNGRTVFMKRVGMKQTPVWKGLKEKTPVTV